MLADVTGWRVRGEGASGEGQPIAPRQLAREIADGVWTDGDEVRGPRDARFVPIGDHPQCEEFLPRRPLFRAKPVEEAELDMTPMIDVTFQLLIFFMISATFVVQKTLDMPAAQRDSQAAARRPTLSQIRAENILVRLAKDGALTVDGQPVQPAGLEKAIRAAGKGRENAELAMDVDDDVDHQAVVAVIDAAAGAQIEKVHFLRRGPPRPKPSPRP